MQMCTEEKKNTIIINAFRFLMIVCCYVFPGLECYAFYGDKKPENNFIWIFCIIFSEKLLESKMH